MTRELLMKTDIGQHYTDGTVDLPRAKEGGLDAMSSRFILLKIIIREGSRQKTPFVW